MFKNNINLQLLISYFGLLPFLFSILDIYYLGYFSSLLIINFIIYYSLLVLTFVGAVNWQYKYNPSRQIILHGFWPSILSTILIFFSFISDLEKILLLIIMLAFILQLFLDFILFKEDQMTSNNFFKIRLPLTILLVSSLYLIIIRI